MQTFKNFPIYVLLCFLLSSCPGFQTKVKDLFKSGDTEQRETLKKAYGPNAARSDEYPDVNRIVSRVGDPPACECCEGSTDPHCLDESGRKPANVTLEKNQGVTSASNTEYKKGCEILDANYSTKLSQKDRPKLKECFDNIRKAIYPTGGKDRNKLFCNMYAYLRPEEQHFMGMILTSQGEAGSTTRNAPAPKHQDLLFVMKTMDNRLRNARRKEKRADLNALDVALSKSQFSMYNGPPDHKRDIFHKSGYHRLFEPGNWRSHNIGKSLSFAAYADFPKINDSLNPKTAINGLSNYYSPMGMTKNSSPANAAKVRKLKAEGILPAFHPEDRSVPNWQWDKIELVKDLNYKGSKPNRKGDYQHYFYVSKNPKRIGYGKMPPPWKDYKNSNRCGHLKTTAK